MGLLQEIANCIINGKAPDTEKLVQQALDSDIPVKDVLNNGLIAGMDVVGQKFKNNEFYVPEVLIAARAMKAGMKLLKPRLAESGIEPIAKLALGTVKGDLHDIGKNLVAMMLEGAGFEIIDLGVDVSPEKYIAAIKENNVRVVGMSALLTTTMLNMKATMEAINNDGLRDSVKVVIGGAAMTEKLAADLENKFNITVKFAPDAINGIKIFNELID